MIPSRGRAWSRWHSLAWAIAVFAVAAGVGRAATQSAYDDSGNPYYAVTQGQGAAHLVLLIAIWLLVWRKADGARTRALGMTVLSVLSLLPIVTWVAWIAIPFLLTAEGLDWPMSRRATVAVAASAPSVGANALDVSADTPRKPTDPISTLQRLAVLRDSGVITNEEYEAKKPELLSRV